MRRVIQKVLSFLIGVFAFLYGVFYIVVSNLVWKYRVVSLSSLLVHHWHVIALIFFQTYGLSPIERVVMSIARFNSSEAVIIRGNQLFESRPFVQDRVK